MPIMATMEISNRNRRGFIQFNIMAPARRAMVSPAKKRLIPIAAFSRVTPNFDSKIIAILVLIATSAPTSRKMASAMIITKPVFSNPRQELSEAGFFSVFDSAIGVAASHKATAIELNP